MKVKDVYILKEAVADLEEGRAFYERQESGVGDYFWDCLIADIESLIIYASRRSSQTTRLSGWKMGHRYLKHHRLVYGQRKPGA